MLFGASMQQDQRQQLSRRLCSLLLSCMKGIMVTSRYTAAGDVRLIQAAVDIATLGQHYCTAASSTNSIPDKGTAKGSYSSKGGTGCSKSSGSSGSSSAAAQHLLPWLALTARCIAYACDLRHHLAGNPRELAASAENNSTAEQDVQVARNPDLPLQCALPCVAWLVDQIEQHQPELGTPGTALEQLQQYKQQVQLMLPYAAGGRCMMMTPGASSSSRPGVGGSQMVSVTGVEVANVLQRLAASAHVELPHSAYCNHLACVNFTGPGELEAVSVKGTVCSGCRRARLCGKECMGAYWLKHKPVCKRLQAARGSEGTCKQ